MIPANELGSSVAKSDGVRKDQKKYTTRMEVLYHNQRKFQEEYDYEENAGIGSGYCNAAEFGECGKWRLLTRRLLFLAQTQRRMN